MRKSYFRAMRIMVTGFIMLLLSGNHAFADSNVRSQEQIVDGYKVTLTFDEGKAKVGHNKLNIRLNNEQGQPVSSASVTVIAEFYKKSASNSSNHAAGMDMSDMKSNNPVSEPAESPVRIVKAEMTAGHETGEYEGEIELNEAGHWMIKVISQVKQQEKSAAFAVDVSNKGPNWLVLGGFMGGIAAFITVAMITRRKPAKAPMTEEKP